MTKLRSEGSQEMEKQLNVEAWIAMFREIGLDDEKMKIWHRLFERRYPEGHQHFLAWLGCSDREIAEIMQRSH